MKAVIDWQGHFRGKKITVMGLGLLGRGIGDAKFLAEQGAELIVTDLKKTEELKTSLVELEAYPNITYVLGQHRLEDFRNRDFIIKAAGVPLDSPYIAEAHKAGVPVKMSTAIFAALTPATIIGVTGTRGKSTVTHLLHEVLLKHTAGTKTKVFVGGNVRGVSTLPFLASAKKGDLVVMELDSWQLQGFRDEKVSPHISIFTNLMDDHLNYYKDNPGQYLEDKANIFKCQKDSDYLVLGKEVAPLIKREYGLKVKSHTIIANAENVPKDWQPGILGLHNLSNIALVIEAAKILGVEMAVVKEAVESFKGMPGRLQYLTTYNGVKIYNDTNATTPDATLAGLQALSKNNNIILIMGGADKNLAMNELLSVLPRYAKKVILLPGTGSEKIKSQFESLSGIEKIQVPTLDKALEAALENVKSGDIILLSPAFASFGTFLNEFDRGEQFVALVNKKAGLH